MTTGSWDTGFTGSTVRTIDQKIWSGADRPKVPYVRPEKYTIFRDGKTYTIRPRGGQARRPKRSMDEPHAYSMTRYSGHDERVFYINNNGDPGTYWAGDFTNYTHDDGTSADVEQLGGNDLAKAIAKLREKIFGSDFNASVFLGEGHQALELITGSATRIYKSLKALKKGNIGDATATLLAGTTRAGTLKFKHTPGKGSLSKTLSQNWLELQYGWLPLLKDAEAGAQMLANLVEVPYRKKYNASVFRAKRSHKTGGGSVPLDKRYSWEVLSEERLKVTVFMTEKPSTAAALGLLNPENVAWELLPWSFVVDWFIPIGQYLDARAVGSCVSGTWVVSHILKAFRGNITGALPSGGYYHRYNHFTRSVSSSAPSLPLPSFKGLDKAASWQHCANAIALLTQLKK